jgi:hypothetical protein
VKKIFLLWGILGIFFLIFSAGAMAAPNFLVNLGTSGSDRFNEVKVTPDGGYAVVGQVGSYTAALKMNVYGNLEWRYLFDEVRHSNAIGIDVDADGYIYVTGYVTATEDHPKSLWVAKLAPWGTVVWEKIVTHDTASSRGIYIAASGDGGCAVSSQFATTDDSNDWSVFRLAADGSLAWARRYGSSEFDMWCRITSVTNPDTGDPDGYLMAEYSQPMGSSVDSSDVVLIRIDNNGAILWAANYAGYADETHTFPENDFVDDVLQTSDGGFAVLGRSYNFTDPAWSSDRRVAYLLKVDGAGAMSWSKYFHHNDGSSHTGAYRSLSEAVDGDLIVASTDYADYTWLLRFSADGVLENVKVYDNDGTDYVYGVDATADNGAVAVGRSNSFGGGDYDAFMIKFDQDLDVLDGCTGVDPGSTVADAEFVAGAPTPHAWDIPGFAAVDYAAPVSDPGFFAGYECAVDQDSDDDGYNDYEDNCPLTANSDQWDGDGDGIGNACDCDLDNSGAVNQVDFMQFRSVWGTADAAADFNADGGVNQNDFMMLRSQWGTSYPWY